MNWLLRLIPWHEHIYVLRSRVFLAEDFRCRCGATISGEDLFPAHTMMGKHWRQQYPST